MKTSCSPKWDWNLNISISTADMKILKLWSFRADLGLSFSKKIFVNRCWPKVWIFWIYAKIRVKMCNFHDFQKWVGKVAIWVINVSYQVRQNISKGCIFIWSNSYVHILNRFMVDDHKVNRSLDFNAFSPPKVVFPT